MSNQYLPSAPNMPPPMYPPSYTPLQVMPGDRLPSPQSLSLDFTSWSKDPETATCPFCGSIGLTRVEYQRGLLAWASCCGITLLGGNCGCCLLPFLISDFKDAYHHCQVCNSLLGIRKPLH